MKKYDIILKSGRPVRISADRYTVVGNHLILSRDEGRYYQGTVARIYFPNIIGILEVGNE